MKWIARAHLTSVHIVELSPMRRSATSAVQLLPQSDTLRAAGALIDFLCAKTWIHAKEIALRYPKLLPQAVKLLPDFIRAAKQQGELDTGLLLADYQQLLNRILAQGPANVGLSEIPKLCCARLKPDAKPLVSTAIDVMLLARPLVAVETDYFSIPSPEDLDTFIERWDRVLQHQGFLQMPLGWRLDALNTAANCRLHRIYTYGRTNDLDVAEGIYQRAIAESPPDWPNLSKYHHNLARALYLRYAQHTGDRTDLDQAIQESEYAVKLKPHSTLFLGELGMLLSQRYELNGLLADLEQAVTVLEQAVHLSDKSARDLPISLNLLGTALRHRFVIKRRVKDIVRAVEVQRLSVEMTCIDVENIPSRLTNLGNSLLEKAALSGSTDELAEAITTFAKTLELSSPTDPLYPSRLNNLANGLSTRYGATRDSADLSQAIDLYGRAVALTPPHKQELASRLYNLGNSLRERWTSTGNTKDETEGREAYAKACVSGLQRDRHWSFFAARNWGEWATARQSWQEASEAYDYGLRAISELVAVQSSQSSKVTWLSQLQGFSAAAAFAFYKNGDCSRAALALEQGRAYLLTEVLQLNSLAVEHLHELGRTDLVARYETAVEDWLTIVQGQDVDPQGEQWKHVSEKISKAKVELERVVATIRKIPGHQAFAASPTLSDIRAAATLSPLVYLAAARAGGIALIVPRIERREILAIELPGLDEHSVRRSVEEYQNSYVQRETEPKRWLSTLDEITRWLWEVCMSGILKQLGRASSACLIPCGLLGLLPLHASWIPKEKRNKKRRYAIEQLRLSYTPNARALLAASQSDRFEGNTLLVVSDPRPTLEPTLKYAQYETRAAVSIFRRCRLLRHSTATRSMVKALLPQYEAVHFACHASAHTADPKRSGFILAGDEVLTLDELLHCRLMRTRLAVLSACETAVPGEELPDEVISLASVFLQTGVDAVIASLWAVLDASTMLLMARFYQLWRRDHMSPCEALRQAQLWMLTTSDREKGREVRGLIPISTYKELVRTPPGMNHFVHPDHWAAFSYVGF